jgi:hypothetical protein
MSIRTTFLSGLRQLRRIVLLACLCGCFPAAALGGGGPENVLLVVNRKSSNSLTIANHYVQLRQIPPGNVLTLPFDPTVDFTDIDTFRAQILQPVLKAIEQRRVDGQIDYIVYSSDFPWGVRLDKDVDKYLAGAEKTAPPEGKKPDGGKPPPKPVWPQYATRVGSLSGLTYLWQPVVLGYPLHYTDRRSNWYMRRDVPEQKDAPTLGFQSSMSFGPQGQVLSAGGSGRHYALSMMLGVTSGRGNSPEEVLSYLKRSALADGTHPRATIYYMENADIRSKVRAAGFPAAVRALKAEGVAAEILQGVLPGKKEDVQGLMTGTADFNWKSCGSTIRPGAICEHFTSFGGDMRTAGAGQTPLSEFLRYGAAGASGTVIEPYAIQEKFPAPSLHVHYARGCTLAEAFYQSVSGPYQLLIVGDPLCRPWANVPQVKVTGVEPRATVKGKLALRPTATFEGKSKVDHFELFVDELRSAACGPEGTLELDTAPLADGFHELRIVAVEAGLIRSQGRQIVPITTANHGRSIEASVAPQGHVRPDKPLVVTAKSPGSMGIAVLHNSHLVGRITGESGRVEINPSVLGFGPVVLRVMGLGDGQPINYVWAGPIQVTIEQK